VKSCKPECPVRVNIGFSQPTAVTRAFRGRARYLSGAVRTVLSHKVALALGALMGIVRVVPDVCL